jgi:hypothetical protein
MGSEDRLANTDRLTQQPSLPLLQTSLQIPCCDIRSTLHRARSAITARTVRLAVLPPLPQTVPDMRIVTLASYR